MGISKVTHTEETSVNNGESKITHEGHYYALIFGSKRCQSSLVIPFTYKSKGKGGFRATGKLCDNLVTVFNIGVVLLAIFLFCAIAFFVTRVPK